MIRKEKLVTMQRLLRYELTKTLIVFCTLSLIGFVIAAIGRLGLASFPNVLENGWGHPESIWTVLIPLFIVGAIALQGIGQVIGSCFLSWVARRIIRRVRTHLLKSLLYKKQSFFDAESPDSLTSILIYHVEQVYSSIASGIIGLIRETLTVLFLFGYLLYLNFWFTCILLLVVPLAVAIVRYIARRFYILSKRIQDSMESISRHSTEMLRAIQLIRLYASVDFQSRQFDTVNQTNYRQNLKLIVTQLMSSFVLEMVVALLVACLVWLVLSNIFGSQFASFGSFISYITTVVLIGQPVKKLSQVIGVIQKGIAAAERVFTYIDLPGEDQTGGMTPAGSIVDITLDQVSMRYPNGVCALNKVNLHIAQGKTIALVGRSGSGKTTVAHLLLRFYDVSEGRIVVNGTNIGELSLAWLRQNFSLVSQQQLFFNDSITSNIAYAEEHIDMKRIRQVADMAHVSEFVNRLEHGFDTPIGDNGALLSGGQKQRLAIARALYRDAPVLILDEATSALDNESDALVQSALAHLTQDKTVLIITHKMTNIVSADNIAVFDKGEIVEQGTHRQLLDKSGLYARLYTEERALDNA